jgi:hypothetical protein
VPEVARVGHTVPVELKRDKAGAKQAAALTAEGPV